MTAWTCRWEIAKWPGLAKSVERYRRSWIAKGRFYTEAEREAWGCALDCVAALLGARYGLPEQEHPGRPYNQCRASFRAWPDCAPDSADSDRN